MQKKYLLAPGPTPVPPRRFWPWLCRSSITARRISCPYSILRRKACSGSTRPRTTCSSCVRPAPAGWRVRSTNFLNPGDDVLVVNGGKFGERWTKICQAYGMKVEEIVVEWGYAVKAVSGRGRAQEGSLDQGAYSSRRTRRLPACTMTSKALPRSSRITGHALRRRRHLAPSLRRTSRPTNGASM